MKKITKWIAAIFVGFNLLYVVFLSVLSYQDYIKQQELLKKQGELSKVMGVDNKNSPHFPVDYLRKTIKPGMTLDEVHKIVSGYEAVYNNDNREIYYYFSKDDNLATRIKIVHDKNNQYKVETISGEDENSRTLTVEGWSEGLLVR